MRAAMYYSNNDIRIKEMPVPAIGRGEILMRVEAGGICGTDVIEWYRANRVPLVLGHEVAGIVEKIGSGVRSYRIGDRISASHHVPCNRCRYCKSGHQTVCETLRKTNFKPGGFAEFIRIPRINVKYGIYKLPKTISFEEATFIEPLACVLRGQRLAGVRKGQTLLIVGSGISGLLHIKLAKIKGVKCIVATDIVKYRLDAAKRFGADFVFDAKEFSAQNLRKVNDGFLADIVILCAGAKLAIEQAMGSVERGGTVLFFAAADKGMMLPLSINDIFWRNEITLTSSYAATPQEHLEALALLKSHRIYVRDMITHRFPLAEAEQGFKLVAQARESIKVIIEPQR